MSNLRESLRTLIEESVDTQAQRNILTDHDLDAIIAVIRGELLSPDAVEAGYEALQEAYENNGGGLDWDFVRPTIEAALNTAFGEENGHE